MPIETPPLRHVSRFRHVQGEPDAPAWFQMAQQVATQAAQPRRSQQQPSGASQLDGMELLFGDTAPPQAQNVHAEPAPPDLDGVELLFGSDLPAALEEADTVPSPYAEPDADTWLARRWQDIRGRRDPREADTGTVFDQFPGELRYPTGRAALAGASDAQMADIIEKQLGDRFIRREKDANGYDVFVTRGPDGQEQRGYVNTPGLDTQDISRGIYGAVPYMIGGGVIGSVARALPWGAQALLQGAGASATSAAGDLAQMPMGSRQGIEVGKATVTGGLGALGPVAAHFGGQFWRRFVIEPSLFNRATGKLTPKGEAFARAEGLDPVGIEAEVARTFAQTYSRTRSGSQAALKAQEVEFGIPSTIGQRTKDKELLGQEEAMRRGIYGDKAKQAIKEFDDSQATAVDFAARTRMPSDFRSQAVRETGTMDPRGITHVQQMPDTADLGANIQSGMRSARDAAGNIERQAWEEVTDILPRHEAFEILPNALAGRLGSMRVTPEMPKAAAMAKALAGC